MYGERSRDLRGTVAQSVTTVARELIKDAVKEALREYEGESKSSETTPPATGEQSSGVRWGRLVVLALLSLGVTYLASKQRGGESSPVEEIKETVTSVSSGDESEYETGSSTGGEATRSTTSVGGTPGVGSETEGDTGEESDEEF